MQRTHRQPWLILPIVAGASVWLAAGQAFAATDVHLNFMTEGTEMQIAGEPDDDQIEVSLADGVITIKDTGTGGVATGDPDCAAVGQATVTCPLDPPDPQAPDGPKLPIFRIDVDLGGGTDSYTNQNLVVHNHIRWATGNKTIASGPGGDDITVGGFGTSSINAGAGNDQIEGGPIPGGADTLDGGPGGADIIVYFGLEGSPGVSISLDGQPNDGFAGEGDNVLGFETLVGTDGPDTMIGDDGPNDFVGFDGNDTIDARGGNDKLFGDFLLAAPPDSDRTLGSGDDVLIGGAGQDEFECGFGLDAIVADPFDVVSSSCERSGAQIGGESARLADRGQTRVLVLCPLEEGAPCAGNLSLLSNGKKLGGGKFNIPAGTTSAVRVRLSTRGRKALERSGGTLWLSAQVNTREPAGVTVNEDRVLLTGAESDAGKKR